ncbi:glycosyltransferase [Vicingaceae bacterium]|nr:glycosyltransferase [Vicingaceae bacterium]MDB4060479.1 glycosyltransferase [Vicingaceae bacterium]
MRHKLIVFIDWFYPSYKAGGPIKSVFNIVSVLKHSHDIRVITSAYDLDGTEVNLEHNELLQRDGYQVIYLAKEDQIAHRVKFLVDEFQPNLIYMNSVFSVNFAILPLFWFKSKFKIIIAPRGMLGAGALKIKALKKSVFLFLGKHFLFDEQLVWHASTQLEAREIKGVIGKLANVRIAQNVSSPIMNRNQSSASKKIGDLKLVFLSRISEKKNLLFFLQLLSKQLELNVTLDIYGPIEDIGYWEECSKYVAKDERIKYAAIVPPNQISEMVQQYHFSILPTKHENYGHSIAESITSLVPVLISKNTPWLNLEKYNVGYDLELDETIWVNCMLKLISMDQVEYDDKLTSCEVFAQERILSKNIIQQNQKLFSIEH